MDPTSILPPLKTDAAQGAGATTSGSGSAAARPAGGFAIKAFEKLFDSAESDRSVVDHVALKGVTVELDIDKTANRIVATVKDRDTGEVLVQFPAEAVLANARGIRELLDRQLDVKV